MKKKILSVFLSLAMAAGVVLVPNGGAVVKSGAITSGDCEYTLNFDFTATITKYKGTVANVKIPTKIDGYKVVEVGGGSTGIFSGNESVKSVAIPKNVKIGSSAFANTKNLTEVTIEKGITAIGGRAFRDCANLTTVNIPNSVTEIGWGAFSGCKKLTAVNIPKSVTRISDDMFSGCSSLKEVPLTPAVTTIASNAFYN